MEYNVYAANSIVFIWVVSSLGKRIFPSFIAHYGLSVDGILEKNQYYRLWSTLWIHSHWSPLLLNTLMLLGLGYATNSPLDTPNFLFVFLMSAVGGNMLALYVSRDDRSGQSHAIGATGGISGVLMANLTLSPSLTLNVSSLAISLPLWPLAVAFLAVSVFAAKPDHGTTNHDAHLGGAIAGLLLSPIVAPDPLQTTLWLAMIFLLPTVVLFYILVKAPEVIPVSASALADHSVVTQKWVSEANISPDERDFVTSEDEMNSLLDRITQSGYHSLSDQERERLQAIATKERA
jgi:membrane associated rhomboid family serine protease